MKIPSKKDSNKILEKLRARFEDMEELGTQNIINDYFNIRTVINQIYAEQKVRSWLTLLTRQYNQQGRTFGKLPNGKYGFASTPAQGNYLATRAYHLVIGHIKRNSIKIVNAQNQKLITTISEPLNLLKPVKRVEIGIRK